MSSVPFEVELVPDKHTRWLVLGGAALLHASGCLILYSLDLSLYRKVPLLVGWLFLACREWRRQLHGYRTVARLRLSADGRVESIDASGRRLPVRLLGGSLLLQHLAWLRLHVPGKLRYAELLLAQKLPAADWHGLQLIWQQRGSRFGRLD